MQRDFDLVVTILGILRDAPTPALATGKIASELDEVMTSPLSTELVRHHLDLLADAGLVKPAAPSGDDEQWRLTWQGYDALEQETEEEDEDDD